MRQVIGDDREVAVPFLLVSNETLQFNANADYWLDVAAFTSLAKACEEHRHRRKGPCLTLYASDGTDDRAVPGDFLAQFFLKDSEAFEEWSILTREWLHREAVDVLTHLARYHERRGNIRKRAYAWQQVELDPWREESHRHLMWLLALNGQRSAALTQYQTCCQSLADELGVEPTSETTTLYEQIRTSELIPIPTALHNLSPTHPLHLSVRKMNWKIWLSYWQTPTGDFYLWLKPGGIGKNPPGIAGR